jgi:hypothetical protein
MTSIPGERRSTIPRIPIMLRRTWVPHRKVEIPAWLVFWYPFESTLPGLAIRFRFLLHLRKSLLVSKCPSLSALLFQSRIPRNIEEKCPPLLVDPPLARLLVQRTRNIHLDELLQYTMDGRTGETVLARE